jgi:hypothetical protein
MVLTAAELADLMPDATQLESNEPEMESSLQALRAGCAFLECREAMHTPSPSG